MLEFFTQNKSEVLLSIISCLIGLAVPYIFKLLKKFVIFIHNKLDIVQINFSDYCTIVNKKQFNKVIKKLYRSETAIDRLKICVNYEKEFIDPKQYSPSDIQIYKNECSVVESYVNACLHLLFSKEAKARLSDFGLNNLEDYTFAAKKVIKLFHGYEAEKGSKSFDFINDKVRPDRGLEFVCVVYLKKESVISALHNNGYTSDKLPEGPELLFINPKLDSFTDKNLIKESILPYLIFGALSKIDNKTIIDGSFPVKNFYDLYSWDIGLH